jgi:hypothetical protein
MLRSSKYTHCSEKRGTGILALNDERRKKGLEVWEPKKASPPPSALGRWMKGREANNT